MTEAGTIANPGSAIGEAIGACMEASLTKFLVPLLLEYDARFLTKGPVNPRTGKPTKLLLYDEFGTPYNLDGVMINESNQPVILFESKYIRYTKHNRDKASWICQAHGGVRRRYTSVRSSIAVLAGNWSASSLSMLMTNETNFFLISFEHISSTLARRGIDFNWSEKDRVKAHKAWETFSTFPEAEIVKIGEEIVAPILDRLSHHVGMALDDSVPREIKKVAIEIYSNLGEVKRFEFPTRDDAINFLEDFSLEDILDHSGSFTIFDFPVI